MEGARVSVVYRTSVPFKGHEEIGSVNPAASKRSLQTLSFVELPRAHLITSIPPLSLTSEGGPWGVRVYLLFYRPFCSFSFLSASCHSFLRVFFWDRRRIIPHPLIAHSHRCVTEARKNVSRQRTTQTEVEGGWPTASVRMQVGKHLLRCRTWDRPTWYLSRTL